MWIVSSYSKPSFLSWSLLNLCQINILRTSRFALDDRCCFHFNLRYCYVHNFQMFIEASQSSFSFAISFINFTTRKLLSTREQLNSRVCFFEFNNVVIVVLHAYLADPYGIYITRCCQVRTVSYSFQIVTWLFQNVLNISSVPLWLHCVSFITGILSLSLHDILRQDLSLAWSTPIWLSWLPAYHFVPVFLVLGLQTHVTAFCFLPLESMGVFLSMEPHTEKQFWQLKAQRFLRTFTLPVCWQLTQHSHLRGGKPKLRKCIPKTGLQASL